MSKSYAISPQSFLPLYFPKLQPKPTITELKPCESQQQYTNTSPKSCNNKDKSTNIAFGISNGNVVNASNSRLLRNK